MASTVASNPHHVFSEAVRSDLVPFIYRTFQTVSPGDEYRHNWHIDAIAHELNRCLQGETKRLIITLPPRNLKSICASVALPAFALGHDPTHRITCASYSQDLANKHARDFRAVLRSPWYKAAFPRTRINPRKDTEAEIETTARGFRYSTSIGGTLTGRGGDFLIRRQLSRGADETPRTFYALVDSVAEAEPERPRSRMSIQLDAVDAMAFESGEWITDDSTLFLARVSSTPNRFGTLFGLDAIAEGDWLKLTVERAVQRPRTWLLPLGAGYEPQPPINSVDIERLDPDSDIVGRLTKDCALPEATGDAELEDIDHLLRSATRLRISALDVGQASCVAFFNGTVCFGYYDVGAPLIFNQKSFPKPFTHQLAQRGFVLLSHWDFYHYALAYRYPELTNLNWYVPQQPVGPNAGRFQRSLGSRLKFISGDYNSHHFQVRKCTGNDRNSSGYAMRVQWSDTTILLTGDADYRWIPPEISDDVHRLVIPHHGGAGTPPPRPGHCESAIAVCSYGEPNSYRHPNADQISAHRKAGWRVRRTAKHGSPSVPRGDRLLYPV